MSQYYAKSGFYKDNLHKKLSGVCAGLGRRYNLPNWLVRGAGIVLFLYFPVAMIIAYLAASIMLPGRYSL